MNSYILSARFDLFDFEEFKKEILEKVREKKGKNELSWAVPKSAGVRKGDSVYIYYSNMPDLLNRIMIKAKVKAVYSQEEDANCFAESFVTYDESKDYSKMVELILCDIKALNPDDIRQFCSVNLTYKYEYSFSPNVCRELKPSRYANLLRDLKNCAERDIEELLNDYLEPQCFFGKDHKTFTRKNGTKYMEYHHFFFRSLARSKDTVSNFDSETKDPNINSNYNYFVLCPTCHRKIHLGLTNEKKEMVDKILNYIENDPLDKKRKRLKNAKEIVKKANKKGIRELAYELYEIK